MRGVVYIMEIELKAGENIIENLTLALGEMVALRYY